MPYIGNTLILSQKIGLYEYFHTFLNCLLASIYWGEVASHVEYIHSCNSSRKSITVNSLLLLGNDVFSVKIDVV